jgi:hypothetical protein
MQTLSPAYSFDKYNISLVAVLKQLTIIRNTVIADSGASGYIFNNFK